MARLSNIGNLLQTAQQLATEAADGSYNSTQLTSIDSQYQAILTSINQIANGASSTGFRCSPAPQSLSRWVRPTPPTISSR